MIIQIRGTSGSGKSYLVKQVMKRFPKREPVYAQPRLFGRSLSAFVQSSEELSRKTPIAYLLRRPGSKKALALLGSYERTCGGADTIASIERGYQLVKQFASEGHHVLFEGLLASELVDQAVDLFKQEKRFLIIGLNTPLEDCLQAVRQRRDASGDERELNPKNTSNRVRAIMRAMERLKRAGVKTVWLDREAALRRVCKELGL